MGTRVGASQGLRRDLEALTFSQSHRSANTAAPNLPPRSIRLRDHGKSRAVWGHYQAHHKLRVDHTGDVQPGGQADELLGTHWSISPASQCTTLPMDTASACRLVLLAEKLPAWLVLQKLSLKAGGQQTSQNARWKSQSKMQDMHEKDLMNSETRMARGELCEAIHSLFLLSKYFLSIYYVLGTVLGSKDPTSLNKMDKVPASLELTILRAGDNT